MKVLASLLYLVALSALAQTQPIVPWHRLWDGPSGMTACAFNKVNPIQWNGKVEPPNQTSCPFGVTYSDAQGVIKGSVPWAKFTASPTTLGTRVIDVTTLVQQQQANANKPIYLRGLSGSSYGVRIAGALSETPPFLIVTTARTDCLCEDMTTKIPVFATSRVNSIGWLDGRQWFEASYGTGTKGALQWAELPLAPIKKAELHLNLTAMGGTSSATIGVFQVEPPEFLYGTVGGTPVQGIASAYTLDQGIENHPDVIKVIDYGNPKRTGAGGGFETADPPAHGWQPLTEPSGFRSLRMWAPVCADRTVTKCSLSPGNLQTNIGGYVRDPASAHGPTRTGRPEKLYDELYSRGCIYFEADYGNRDGTKLPFFLSSQSGVLKQRSDGTFYWQPYVGNGGALGSGKWQYYTSGGWQYAGNSTRGHGDGLPEDGNPLAGPNGFIGAGAYDYFIPSTGVIKSGFGVNRMANRALQKQVWNCIETRQKINSVAGPYDEHGNGTPVADGELDIWINGILSAEYRGLKWRANINYSWTQRQDESYHGGASPQANAIWKEPYRIAFGVISLKPIGLPGGLPVGVSGVQITTAP